MADSLRITLRVELETALHILGPGRPVVLVDKPLELDSQGYPLIPASTIRGRLRVHLERLLRGLDLPVCFPPRPERLCPHVWGQQPAPEDGYCIACRVFGSPWREAGLAASDLRLVADQRSQFAPALLRQERAGVSLSRRLGAAQNERLFMIESTVPRANAEALRFEGTLEGRLSSAEAGWLLATLPLVAHIGGGKSRGLGGVRLRATAVAWWRNGSWTAADPDALLTEVLGDATDPYHA